MTPKPKFSTGDEVVIVDTEIFGPDTPIKNGDVGIIYSIVPNHATDTEACYRIELEAENTLVWESQIEYKDTPPEPEHHQEPAPPATDSTPEPTEEQPLEIVEVGVTLFYKRPGRDGAEKGLGVNARARVPVGIDWADVQDQVYEAQRQQLTQLFSRGGRRG